jgi:hypothetical protein
MIIGSSSMDKKKSSKFFKDVWFFLKISSSLTLQDFIYLIYLLHLNPNGILLEPTFHQLNCSAIMLLRIN